MRVVGFDSTRREKNGKAASQKKGPRMRIRLRVVGSLTLLVKLGGPTRKVNVTNLRDGHTIFSVLCVRSNVANALVRLCASRKNSALIAAALRHHWGRTSVAASMTAHARRSMGLPQRPCARTAMQQAMLASALVKRGRYCVLFRLPKTT